MSTPTEATRRPAPPAETATANRTWWDGEAASYYVEHGSFLGDTDFVWGPERLREEDARLLGDPAGQVVLEIGAGSGQCSRWLAAHGATVVATDLSAGMVATGVAVNDSLDPARRHGPRAVRAVRRPRPPLRRRVLRHGLHGIRRRAVRRGLRRRHGGGGPRAAARRPVRLLDDPPGAVGLPRRPGAGRAHGPPLVLRPHALRRAGRRGPRRPTSSTTARSGDRVREITAAGLVLVDLVEPEWPEGHEEPWGGWSPLRGRVIPGTAIFVCRKPA